MGSGGDARARGRRQGIVWERQRRKIVGLRRVSKREQSQRGEIPDRKDTGAGGGAAPRAGHEQPEKLSKKEMEGRGGCTPSLAATRYHLFGHTCAGQGGQEGGRAGGQTPGLQRYQSSPGDARRLPAGNEIWSAACHRGGPQLQASSLPACEPPAGRGRRQRQRCSSRVTQPVGSTPAGTVGARRCATSFPDGGHRGGVVHPPDGLAQQVGDCSRGGVGWGGGLGGLLTSGGGTKMRSPSNAAAPSSTLCAVGLQSRSRAGWAPLATAAWPAARRLLAAALDPAAAGPPLPSPPPPHQTAPSAPGTGARGARGWCWPR